MLDYKDPFDEIFVLKDILGNPISGFAYKITTADGRIYRGITNTEGQTTRIHTGGQAIDMTVEADDEGYE